MRLNVLSYNIHKGFGPVSPVQTLTRIKSALDLVSADIVCLQELAGKHRRLGNQLEILADRVWPHSTYGKNAVYTGGHHGNAILSKFPFQSWENLDTSQSRLEQRSHLYGQVQISKSHPPLHLICTHLGLLHRWRKKQLLQLRDWVKKNLPDSEPLMVCGDFNDWNTYASRFLKKELGLDEAFHKLHHRHARTCPSWLPILKLDRIYTKRMKILGAEVLALGEWRKLSDHLPVKIQVEL